MQAQRGTGTFGNRCVTHSRAVDVHCLPHFCWYHIFVD